MKRFLYSFLLLNACYLTTIAQPWQGQIGLNLATLPGKSVELATAWSPDLNKWALTANVGYTYQNSFAFSPSGFLCDCGLHDLKTSGAFIKAGYRNDVIRSGKSQAKVGLPVGLVLIGSQYQQEGTVTSFPDGQTHYSVQSAQGVVLGLGLTAAMNVRFSSRWNMDIGIQKFAGFKKRTDYLLFSNYATHQPGVGLTNWKSFWPGMQGIVTLNYRLRRL